MYAGDGIFKPVLHLFSTGHIRITFGAVNFGRSEHGNQTWVRNNTTEAGPFRGGGLALITDPGVVCL